MSQPSPDSQPPSSPQTTSNPGFAKKQSVRLLRGTINILEKLVTKLETEPTAASTPLLQQLQSAWSRVLATIRNFLPESTALSDTALTGVIAGIMIVVVGITFVLLPSPPPEVAEVPPVLVQKEPEAPPQIVEPTPEEPELIPTPTELVAPESPQPVAEIPSPVPSDTPAEPVMELALPPVVELTPEQSLIAAIEKQVAQVSDRYGDGIIQSLQVNFPANSLTVQIKTDWYNLEPSQQDMLSAQMFQRAKELDFIYLEVVDSQGNLLARSPFIGENMIILKRQA